MSTPPVTSAMMNAALAPLTPPVWLTGWSPDIAAIVLAALTSGLYLLGVRRVRHAGDAWPASTTRWFLLAGAGSWLVVTCSFLGAYARVLFWPLAVQDVLILTLVPLGLTLGRPLALYRAARTSRPRAAQPARPGRAMIVRIAAFPLTGSVVAVTVLLSIYTTEWDQARLEHPWLLAVTRLALLLAGCGFLWPLLGVDAGTGSTSYPLRAVIAFLDGLLDALPGLAVLGTGHVIAGGYYRHLHRSWGVTPARAQQIGGTAMIALSELVGLPALLILLVAWVRNDATQASRVDAALDAVSAAERAAHGMQQPSHDNGDGAAVDQLQRPWWELNAGPLTDRAARHGWGQDSDTPEA